MCIKALRNLNYVYIVLKRSWLSATKTRKGQVAGTQCFDQSTSIWARVDGYSNMEIETVCR